MRQSERCVNRIAKMSNIDILSTIHTVRVSKKSISIQYIALRLIVIKRGFHEQTRLQSPV